MKAYDKAETVLRIETTINQPGQFRVYRTKQGEEQGGKAWRPLRKSVVDLHRRAEVSQQINDRYEEALASLDTTQEIIDLVAPICRSIRREGVRYRAMRPWSEEDRCLLEAVSRADYVAGFTNGDIADHLYSIPARAATNDSERADCLACLLPHSPAASSRFDPQSEESTSLSRNNPRPSNARGDPHRATCDRPTT